MLKNIKRLSVILALLVLVVIVSTGCLADEMTGVVTVITYPHEEVHEGHSFFTDYVDATLAINETIVMVFRTPVGTTRAHMTGEFTTLVGGNIQVWEDPIWTTNTGVLNPIMNRFREPIMDSSILLEDLTATPLFTATDNILVNVAGLNTAGATSLHHFYAWGAQGRGARGGARDSEEIILEADTQYAIVFTSVANNNSAQIILNWYEHTDIVAVQEVEISLLGLLIFIAVLLTCTMFITREMMLGFACTIFWAIAGAQSYTLSIAAWDVYFVIAFACLLGMTSFTALGAFGLREKRDSIADEELEEGEGSFIGDEEKVDDIDYWSGKDRSERVKTLRENAKQRRARSGRKDSGDSE